MYAFVDERREKFGVEPICKVLQVAPSAYRRRVARQRNPGLRSPRALRDERLGRLLKREFMHILRQPGVTSRDRMRMKRIFNIAQTKKGTFSEWLSTKDYELSLMLAAARRVESLLRTRERLSQGYR